MARRYTDRRKLERNRRLLEFDRADRPAAPFVRFHLGWPLLDLGDPAAALAACRAGQSVAPRDAELACLEAEGRLATGNPVGAAARFGAFLAGGWDNDPRAFADGYRLKDVRTSVKLGVRLRRVRSKSGDSFSIRPSFVLPYMVGYADEVGDPLFLRAFGVPFWALARVFGQGFMFWYRLELALGRNSVVGATVRQADLPEHLQADEHHQPCDGLKNYIATTVGEGCCLGSALAQTAGAEDLQAAYGVFKTEARDVEPDYAPWTVSVDASGVARLMLDRVMRPMNRYFDDGQHLHGGAEACDLHCRAWALLHNFRPWHPAMARENDGWRSPAERLNRHRYHDDWLQNLLISASLGGFRR